jgi:hypothetical protein
MTPVKPTADQSQAGARHRLAQEDAGEDQGDEGRG